MATLGLCATLVAAPSFADAPKSMSEADKTQRAKQYLSNKMKKLSDSLEMKIRQGAGGAAGEFDGDSGVSSRRDGTNHFYLAAFCQKWMEENGNKDIHNCEKWIGPGVSTHPLTGDQSPSENSSLQQWNAAGGDQKQTDGQFGSLEVKKDGPLIDEENRVDFKGATNLRLNKQAYREQDKIGENAGKKMMKLTMDENAPKEERTLGTPEEKRIMAGRLTKMWKEHATAKIRAARALRVEVVLGDDIPDCQTYAQRVQQESEDFRNEDRLSFQGPLSYDNQAMSLEDRVKACEALVAANPLQATEGTGEGESKEENIYEKLERAQLASIERGGISSAQLSQIAGVELDADQVTQQIGSWNSGATEMKEVREENGKTLKGYNAEIQRAANAMKAVSSRSENVVDNSDEWLKNQIPEGVALDRVNDLTLEQQRYLAGTGAPKGDGTKVNGRGPASADAPPPDRSELTIERLN